MATYDKALDRTYLAIVRGDQGWSVPIPGWWTIEQVERYLAELEDWS